MAFAVIGIEGDDGKAGVGVFKTDMYDIAAYPCFFLISLLHAELRKNRLSTEIVDKSFQVGDKPLITGNFTAVSGQEVDDFSAPRSE